MDRTRFEKKIVMKRKIADTQLSLFPEDAFGTPVNPQPPHHEHEAHTSEGDEDNIMSEEKADYDHTALFERLAKSDFRSSFHLKMKDIAYIQTKGMSTIRQHAADFVKKRLAPAYIANDGKQTPMRGHPVFLAQHATGCCCRGCFFKWHHIPIGRQLTDEEQRYAVSVLMTWIEEEYQKYNRHNQ